MKKFDELISTIKILRSDKGCPWDRKQTFESLRDKFIEEAYEVVQAVNNKDYENLQEELGDLLTLILLYADIAKKANLFSIEDVLLKLNAKLIRRHPHVFGDENAETANDVIDIWEKVKNQEKKKYSIDAFYSKIKNYSNLSIAKKIQDYAAEYNFDWPDYKGPLEKVKEETEEIKEAINESKDVEIEVGDLIFAAVNLSRKLKIDPNVAIYRTITKVVNRIKYMEKYCEDNNIPIEDCSLEELDKIWEKSKEENQ
jgi:tetrapyrrole methylase family protein/MazG family protein